MGGCRRISNEDFESLSQVIFRARLAAAMGCRLEEVHATGKAQG